MFRHLAIRGLSLLVLLTLLAMYPSDSCAQQANECPCTTISELQEMAFESIEKHSDDINLMEYLAVINKCMTMVVERSVDNRHSKYVVAYSPSDEDIRLCDLETTVAEIQLTIVSEKPGDVRTCMCHTSGQGCEWIDENGYLCGPGAEILVGGWIPNGPALTGTRFEPHRPVVPVYTTSFGAVNIEPYYAR